MNIIRISGIRKVYAMGAVKIPALDGISFDVSNGEIVSIVGKSGSGKSTLLNMLGGLDTPSSGQLFFNDKDITRMNRTELALHRRHTVGMIFQSFNLIASYSAMDNVMLALTFGGVARNEKKQKAKSLLEQVGLGERMHHKPSELSGGEAQRVAIARALANNPSVLLADEPTGNLDSTTSEEIINLLQNLNRENGLTIVLVTHDQEMAANVSQKMIRLKDGKVINETTKT